MYKIWILNFLVFYILCQSLWYFFLIICLWFFLIFPAKIYLIFSINSFLSECCSFGQWDHLRSGFWLWLFWLQNPGEVLPLEGPRKSCRKTPTYVDEGCCWDSQGWHWFCYQNIPYDVSTMVYPCISHTF